MLQQKTDNQYFGRDSDKPFRLPKGSQFLAIDTETLYLYGDDESPKQTRFSIPVKALSLITSPSTGMVILDSEDLNTFKWYDGTDWKATSNSFTLATGASGSINETKSLTRSGKTSFGGDDPDRQVEIIGDYLQREVIDTNGSITVESGDQVLTALGHTTEFTGTNSTYILEGGGVWANSFAGIFNAASEVDVMCMQGVGKGGSMIAPTDYARMLASRANPAQNGGNDHLLLDFEVKNGSVASKFRIRGSRIEFGDAIKFTALGSQLYSEGDTYTGSPVVGEITIGAPVSNISVDAQGHLMNTPLVPTFLGYTVATLPAGTVGDKSYVTDATTPTYLGTLTGGGAVTCPVFYDGTNWVSH